MGLIVKFFGQLLFGNDPFRMAVGIKIDVVSHFFSSVEAPHGRTANHAEDVVYRLLIAMPKSPKMSKVKVFCLFKMIVPL